MADDLAFSRHARDRSTARAIPVGIASLIIDYGEPIAARDGAQRFALSRQSYVAIKRDFGPAVAKAMAIYRTAFVVLGEGRRVITVAHAARPLLH
jgi:hypothetical protein